jgi:hypothetical protein
MPRLVHRPPAYRRHKSTNQAIVSFLGDKIYLGPYGSPCSLAHYQELLKKWDRVRHQQSAKAARDAKLSPSMYGRAAVSITAAKLREKRRCGVPITVTELIFVYRNHTQQYYRKDGEVTREAGVIDDALRILRKHHGNTYLTDFGPLALDELRKAMIDELDWSRKYINKQVSRIRSMFKWAASKEIVDASVPAALRELPGLKKGRSSAREIIRG